MSTYHQSYCPYCDHRIRSTPHPVSYGNPIKLCPACGKKYIDSYCTEPALREYKPLSVGRLLWNGCSDGLVLAALAAIITEFITDSNTTVWIAFGIAFLISAPLRICSHFRSQKEYFEKRRLECWQESDQRLRDPKHAAALKFYGYNVPPKYLPSGYWKDRDTLTYPGATVETSDSFRKKRNPPPHMPNGTERYY